jgi:outer membrane murein-binding lipoprotein Lpp
MPVDKEALKDAIREAAGEDGELYAFLEQKMLANDKIATQFLGGFMRNKDYTQKNQALATDRQTIEADRKTMEDKMEQFRQLLEAAEVEKAKVLKDLAQHKIDVATSQARLKHIKQTYQLSDDDIPNIPDQIETFQTRRPVDTSTDIDTKLADFKKDFKDDITKYLAEKLVPELGGMAQLDIIWADIRDQHRELTGKRMSAKEAQELFNEADRRGRAGKPISLASLWEEKYDVPALRQKHHDEDLSKKLRADWDAEQAAKLSEAALAGVRPGAMEQGLRTSHVFDHKFKVHEETQPQAAPKLREAPSAADRQALSGAERASRRYIERRANGIPMGAPDERKPTKVA